MKFLTLLLLLLCISAFAHGEKKPGPHGGQIRMPGNFHTEVLMLKNGFKIYLLDIAFKEPLTKDSSVAAQAYIDGKATTGHCMPKKEHFECHFPGDLSKYSKLSIMAVRKGQKGKEANYTLPLEFKGKASQAPAEDHSQHH